MKKRILLLMMAISFSITMYAQIEDATSGLYYVIEEVNGINQAVIVAKNGTAYTGVINIPDTVKRIRIIGLDVVTYYYPVGAIGDSAFFQNTGITAVNFSKNNHVKVIGLRAFQACNQLTSLVLPEGLDTVDNFAFSQCVNLESITFPSTLKYIGNWGFLMSGTTKLQYIECHAAVPPTLGVLPFKGIREDLPVYECCPYIEIYKAVWPFINYECYWSDKELCDTTWYDNTKDTFEISTAAELGGLARIVNQKVANFNNKVIKLKADINLAKYYWEPISYNLNNNSEYFSGTFEGNNYTIDSINGMNYLLKPEKGLFGNIYEATLSNVHIGKGCSIKDTLSKIAGLVGMTGGDANYSYIIHCSNAADITTTKDNVGGLIGENYSYTYVVNSWNTGNITGRYNVGGIVGYQYESKIYNCYNRGEIDGVNSVGGITSHIEGGFIKNNYNQASIKYDYMNETEGGCIIGWKDYGYCDISNYWIANDCDNGMVDFGTAVTTNYIIKDTMLNRLNDSVVAYNVAYKDEIQWLPWKAGSDKYPVLFEPEYWSDLTIYDKSWYNETKDTFEISTAAELGGLAYLLSQSIENFDGQVINLKADIDLSAYSWKPIGNESIYFLGTFNGGNHIIDYLHGMEEIDDDGVGLFGGAEGAAFYNIHLGEHCVIASPKNKVGGILGYGEADNVFVNCSNAGSISGYRKVGGIIGESGTYDRLINCYNTGNITADAVYVGGLCGILYNTYIANSYNRGEISGKDTIGGIIGGYGCEGNTLYNCYNHAKVNATADSIGAISGVFIKDISGVYYMDSDCSNATNHIGTAQTDEWMKSEEAMLKVLNDSAASYNYYNNPAHKSLYSWQIIQGQNENYPILTNEFAKIKEVSGIELNRKKVSVLIDSTLQLIAHVVPADAFFKDVIWKSLNNSIVTVDSNGLVTAKAVGTTTIVVYSKNLIYTDSCLITVVQTPIAVTGVILNKTTLSLKVDQTEQLIAFILPDSATNLKVVWTSQNNEIATVDSNGLVTAVSVGNTEVTVTTGDGNFEAKCAINVTLPTMIEEEEEVDDVRIFARDYQVVVSHAEGEKIEVYNMTGQLIRQTISSTDCEYIPIPSRGFYIVRIKDRSYKIVVR